MDVYNDGKRIVRRERAIGQNPDRFGAKRTLELTPVATARVHHAIRGLRVRLCSWLAAASVGGQNGMAAAAWRQVSVDFAYRLKRPDAESAQPQETIHGGL